MLLVGSLSVLKPKYATASADRRHRMPPLRAATATAAAATRLPHATATATRRVPSPWATAAVAATTAATTTPTTVDVC
jgi:hypothetical protein